MAGQRRNAPIRPGHKVCLADVWNGELSGLSLRAMDAELDLYYNQQC